MTSKGVVKIADITLINDETSIYYKLFSHSNIENHYVSPEIIESLKKSILSPQYDVHKNDVFAFGMTILESASLEYSSICYDFDKFSINLSKIKIILDALKDRYSPFFINFLSDLLQEKEKYRPNFDDLFSLLLPFQSEKTKNSGMMTNARKTNSPKKINEEKPQKINIKKEANKFENSISPYASNKENSQNIYDTINEKHSSSKQMIFLKENERNLHVPLNNNKNMKDNSSKLKNETSKKAFPLSLKENNMVYQHESIHNERKKETAYQSMTAHNDYDDYNINKREDQIHVDLWQAENERLDEIERKINEALRLSEETIKMHGN